MTTHTSSSSSTTITTTTTAGGGRWNRVQGERGRRSDTKGYHSGTFRRRRCGSKSGGRGGGQPRGMESHRVCVCVCERERE